MLCLPGNFPFHEVAPGVQARGFEFTAYLSSDRFQTLANENRQDLIELDALSESLLASAKSKLKHHFRSRESSLSEGKIEQWKAANIYPFEGDASTAIERNERSVFNILAINLSDYSADFDSSPQQTQKLIFQLLRNSIESDPKTLSFIFENILNLPKQKQDELADLLKKTSLTSVINAAKAVTERLDFLKALQLLVFEPKAKKELLERKQLHRILADQTWLFGERYNLTADDNDLTTVLRRHLKILDKKEDAVVDGTVKDFEGKKGVVDLVLSRRVPLPSGEEREHLVVELKRPSQKITSDAINQLTKYALAIAKDDRFAESKAKWTYITISNQLDDLVTAEATQKDKPKGLVRDLSDPPIQIWVKTWSQIIQENEGRMRFFKEQLEYSANDTDALNYLAGINEKYLPPSIIKDIHPLGGQQKKKRA